MPVPQIARRRACNEAMNVPDQVEDHMLALLLALTQDSCCPCDALLSCHASVKICVYIYIPIYKLGKGSWIWWFVPEVGTSIPHPLTVAYGT